MTGIPSIVAGLFALALVVLIFGPAYRMGLGGSVALSLLMIPTVVRSSEEMFRLVPDGPARGVVRARRAEVAHDPQGGAARPRSAASSPASCWRSRGSSARPRRCWSSPVRPTAMNFNLFDGRMTTLPVFIYSQYAQSTPAGYAARLGRRAGADRDRDGAQPRRPRARQAPRPQESLRGTHDMAKSIDVSDLEHLLRRLPRRRGRHDDHQGAVGDRVHRPVRLRQVHDAAVAEPDARGDPRRPRRGQGDGRRAEPLRRRRRPGRRTPLDRDGLPAAQPVPDDVDLRQRARRLPAELQQAEEVQGRRDRRAVAEGRQPLGTRSRTGSASPARVSPAASSSGSASPARSPSSPRCC